VTHSVLLLLAPVLLTALLLVTPPQRLPLALAMLAALVTQASATRSISATAAAVLVTLVAASAM
jgi:hypothetical protein